MKLTSVIFLIISVILIFSGIFLCDYARDKAPNEGAIDGYVVNKNGDTVVEHYFEEGGMSTITVDLNDCDIQIIKGGETSYVVMENFLTSRYICAVSGKILTVSNNITLADYINFDGTGVKFGGVWQTLRAMFVDKGNTDRTIYVYIGEEEIIKQINVNSNGGVVRLVGFNDGQNVKLTVNNSTVELDGITAESITVDSTKSDITVTNTSSKSFEGKFEKGKLDLATAIVDEIVLEAEKTKLNLLSIASQNIEVTCKGADIKLSTLYTMTDYILRATAPDGKITVGDSDMGTEINTADGESHPGNIKIVCEGASVTLTFGDMNIPVETPDDSETPDDDSDSE